MLTKAQVETKAQTVLQTYGTNVTIKTFDDINTVMDDLYEESISKLYTSSTLTPTIKVRWDFSPTIERLTAFGSDSDKVKAILLTTKKELRVAGYVSTLTDKCLLNVDTHKVVYENENWDIISIKESGQWDDSFLIVKIGVAKK